MAVDGIMNFAVIREDRREVSGLRDPFGACHTTDATRRLFPRTVYRSLSTELTYQELSARVTPGHATEITQYTRPRTILQVRGIPPYTPDEWVAELLESMQLPPGPDGRCVFEYDELGIGKTLTR